MTRIVSRCGRILTALALFSTATHAQSLTAFAGVVAGQGTGNFRNGCTTYGDPAELARFNPVTSLQTANPSLSTCGYSGGYSQLVGTTGPLLNSRSLSNQPMGNSALFSGSANAKASYGSLGASATGTTNAGVSSTSLSSSAGAATFTDFLTAISPIGPGNGFVQYVFSVDGSLTASGPGGIAFTQLILSQNNATPSEIMRATLLAGASPSISNQTVLPTGWTGSVGSLVGASTFFSALIPVTWGTSWQLTVGLLANTGGNAQSQFLTTARITGVNFFDNSRVALSGVTLQAQSGTDYYNVGVTPPPTTVPEPSTTVLAAAGLLSLAIAARRRN